ncbi:DUF1667 domain-containing protein [Proteiniclasticum sp. BAD-10]|jgi:CxxC motif-containing protein|uniref:DUF1667 domain-containing protein n=1 Tax=Proteiniclasticum sediminis TaxID=2804028 RepID=A0A941HQS4_9CLOT|nr:DUF1667 domain-containing protein [Proteiniclasticum sediminis]MBR0576716.1 DUF1667 domain-containing protein [Proteiniclasticum sediminis]
MKKEYYTSVIRIKGSQNHSMVPVRSDEPVSHDRFIEISKVLSRIYVGVPLKRGDIICNNILNMGVNIIVTKSIDS